MDSAFDTHDAEVERLLEQAHALVATAARLNPVRAPELRAVAARLSMLRTEIHNPYSHVPFETFEVPQR